MRRALEPAPFVVRGESIVRIVLASLAAVTLVSGSLAGSSFHQSRQSSAPAPMSVDEAVKALRADLQASRADILAKNISLTAEQAGKFWPMYDKFQKEQNVIMEEQLKGIHQYIDGYETLDDAGALGLIKAHLDRDQRMATLRLKWLQEFQKVVPAKTAARVMQIDRRLSMAYQMEMSAQIPLIE
jgi:Spy/CpxP family protein refolding chaperone